MTQHAMTKSTDQNQNLSQKVYNLLNDESRQKNFLALLGNAVATARFTKIAYGAVVRNPELLKCSSYSLIKSVMDAAELRLNLNGVLGEAYLVPYNNRKTNQKEAQFQIGYRGYNKLICRSGKVRNVSAGHVYKADRFEVEYGIKEKLIHVPNLGRPKDDELIAAYAVAHFANGGCAFVVLGIPEIEHARAASASVRSGRQSPWDTDYPAMCEKTALNKLAKRLPLSDDDERAVEVDDLREKRANANISDDVLMLPEPEDYDPETGEIIDAEATAADGAEQGGNE